MIYGKSDPSDHQDDIDINAMNHKHTNRLIHETSPYLLQHAHNPVDWHAWGEEALAKAKTENKPILLSIGYSACHWCHVMEHESFENEDIAQLMNDNFVNIKVDREERPDLDQIYMNAVQMMTHHGGWPMTVFLTPEGVPFYGGTYFPPEDRYNMPGFPRVLLNVADAYETRAEEIKTNSIALLSELRRVNQAAESTQTLSLDLLDAAYRGSIKNYEPVHGGFGSAPKFPPAMTLEFLMKVFHRTGDAQALEIVNHTSQQMAHGGIYDQLGGGFHRYSTDSRWLVPHFEKMLYDNALLSRQYLHLYQLTHDTFAKSIVEGTLDYVVREMTDAGGGFYSTQDADSEGHEGKFFVWTVEEIEAALGNERAQLFCAYFNVTAAGNFEGKNILNVTQSMDEVAQAENVTLDALESAVKSGIEVLFDVREQRIKPGRDEKILTAWNGLMLASFAEAGAILKRDDYTEIARNNARFVLTSLYRDGLLLRTSKDGQSKLNGYLEDYAFFAEGLLTLFEATGEFEWFDAAARLTTTMIDEFWDEADGGFFFTGKSHEQLILRSKDYFDNATPSGNSVAADLLLRLSILTGNEDYSRRAVTIFRMNAQAMQRYPPAFGRALGALDFHLSGAKEIVILGDPSEIDSLKDAVWEDYLPNKVVLQASNSEVEDRQLLPLLTGRKQLNNRPTAFVCEHFVCKQPVNETEELRRQLSTGTKATDVS
ncbi:MAG TPA: thioredoxin domain-containing protein [Pyrinomonadaceae bacterium]|nr:thioredoxin domain-containing protein [Pyrinomonadaceae bacterium]